ncbi:MAG TPA: prepilin-type N-terminal cleavage/methylation domain-containing protein [Candidatus Acidoferrales bacterium]|nr:prepilin-type N-terminal cleavage/methylation domain-containing protein [Candidatus Acidoferrales bacterium]
MNRTDNKSQHGFTLIELLVASALGLIVILAMTSLFKMGMDATFTVTQRAELQENMRAGIELMTHDISHAGAGLPTGGLQLVTGGTVSKYGCDQTTTCYVPSHTYPTNVSTGVANYMYGIIPGNANGVQGGVTIAAAPAQRDDSITTIYEDYNFPLTNFTFAITSTTTATATLIASPNTSMPTNILGAGGLNVGDLLLFTVSTPGNGTGGTGTSMVQNAAIVAEITGIAGAGPWVLTFATGDALNLNQTGTTSNNLSSLATAMGGASAQTSVARLNVVTYFLQVPTAGGTVQYPRLMRQVNGLTPIPVADNIINLQFSYDVIDAYTGYLSGNLANPIGSGQSPSTIQKVNIWIMGQSLTSGTKKAQSMYLITSVSASDMSFCNSYSASTTACAND